MRSCTPSRAAISRAVRPSAATASTSRSRSGQPDIEFSPALDARRRSCPPPQPAGRSSTISRSAARRDRVDERSGSTALVDVAVGADEQRAADRRSDRRWRRPPAPRRPGWRSRIVADQPRARRVAVEPEPDQARPPASGARARSHRSASSASLASASTSSPGGHRAAGPSPARTTGSGSTSDDAKSPRSGCGCPSCGWRLLMRRSLLARSSHRCGDAPGWYRHAIGQALSLAVRPSAARSDPATAARATAWSRVCTRKLAIELRNMRLDGPRRDPEATPDLARRQPLRQQREDLPFSRA